MTAFTPIASAPVAATSAIIPVSISFSVSGVSATSTLGTVSTSTGTLATITSVFATGELGSVSTGSPKFILQTSISPGVSNGYFGTSIAFSADGNTMAVGAAYVNANIGKVYIYTRSGTSWSYESTLTGTGYSGNPQFGFSLSLSSDGNTIAFSGYQNNSTNSAVWVFTRSGTTWTQQAGPITPTGLTGVYTGGWFGYSLSLAGDGNTLVVGAPRDASGLGSVFVFTRSGSTWSQAAGPFRGSGYSGSTSVQGVVCISQDGTTLAVGGIGDGSGSAGAVWVFTGSGSSWTQQGSKLTVAGSQYMGDYLALSANGDRLLIGGVYVYTYTRTGGVWTYRNTLPVNSGYEFTASMNDTGTLLVVSSRGPAAAYAYTFDGFNIAQYGGVITEPGQSLSTYYGYRAALSSNGGTLGITAYTEDTAATDAGKAWVYTNLETTSPNGVYATGVIGSVTVLNSQVVNLSGVSADVLVNSVTPIVVANQVINAVGNSAIGQIGNVSVISSVNTGLTSVSATGQIGNVNILSGTVINLTGVQGLCVSNFVYVSVNPNITITGVSCSGAVGSVTTTGSSVYDVTTPQITSYLGNETVITSNVVEVLGLSCQGIIGAVTVDADNTANVLGVEGLGVIGSVTLTTDVQIYQSGFTLNGYIGDVIVGQSIIVPTTGVFATIYEGVVDAGDTQVIDVDGFELYGVLGRVAVWNTVNDSQVSDWKLVNTVQS